MSIKSKILVSIVTLCALAALSIYFFSDTIILENIKTQEKNDLLHKMEHAEKILGNELASLNSTCLDWASRNDTYNFIQNKNASYIETSLSYSNFSNLNVDFAIFADLNGNVIYGKAFDKVSSQNTTNSDYLNSVKDIVVTLYNTNSSIYRKFGLMFIDNKPVIISSNTITKSNRQSAPNGILIMGRFIGSDEKSKLDNLTSSRIEIREISGKELSSQRADLSIKDNKYNFITKLIDDDTIEGQGTLKDIHGNASILLTLQSDRHIFNEGYKNFKLFIIHLIFIIFAITILSSIFGLKFFILKLEKLSKFILKVRDTKDITLRIEMKGHDEFSTLANATNSMLERIETANIKLAENEKRLTQVMEGSNDGFWDINMSSKSIYFSPKFLDMLGYKTDEKIDFIDVVNTVLPKQEFDYLIEFIGHPVTQNLNFFNKEHKVTTKSGEIKWLLCKGKVVERDDQGNPIILAGTASDITSTKEAQLEIEYLSYHDSLTGLFNRYYLFKELERINKEEKFPLSIVMGDVNGLKLINDAFGHKAGDAYLMEVASILKASCDDSAIIARLGGDEFIIVLPEATEQMASEVCKKIKHNCRESALKPVRPSISLGSTTQYEPVEAIHELLEIAEDRMYNQKLLESKSTRHSVIALMEHSLLETDFETREHTERLYGLARKMGKYLKLPNNTLNELYLLSKLHDIGKIAIPREILTKPGALTQSEWEVIKKHVEIGYRMALSSHDLIPIADGILSHHERWDGSGYPRGLKGEDTPLISRIIAIIDAYDVITHARPYKAASTHEEAMNEILKCSGTHFDPELVEVFKKMFEETNQG